MVRLNSFVTEAQLKTLGPMTTHEKISLTTVVVSLAGFLTQPWHQIDVAWVAMLSFLILFASSVLNEKAVRSDIDWNSLVSFGAFVSFANVISETGLITIIANGIKPYTELLAKNQSVFLLSVALAMHLLRFVLPLQPALLVSVLSIMPILSTMGIHPLVVGLITLASGNPWFLPYQDIMYQNLTEVTEGKLFSHEQTVRLAFIRFLILLAAITISIPLWKQWNLIP